MKTPTPHISAAVGDFAKTVIMPGDPLRAKMIAEKFLCDARLVNNVRGIQGYTGTYKGVPVSVMASGMGCASMGIYSYELYSAYGVENIIRVGSAGSMREDIKLRDIVIAQGVCTNSNYAIQYNFPGTFAPICDYGLLEAAVNKARAMKINCHVGNVFSSDIFYNDNDNTTELCRKMGVMAVEMESAALYMNAARLGKKAITVCTVSDSLLTGEKLSSDERQNSFAEMITLALEVSIEL